MIFETDSGYEQTIDQFSKRLAEVEKERDTLQDEVDHLTLLDEHSSATFDALVTHNDGLLLRGEKAEAKLKRVKATVRFLYPDDMTPSAKRVFDSILEDKE